MSLCWELVVSLRLSTKEFEEEEEEEEEEEMEEGEEEEEEEEDGGLRVLRCLRVSNTTLT